MVERPVLGTNGGSQPRAPRIACEPAYITDHGTAYCGDAMGLLELIADDSVQLFITSPPFALLREKEYGNRAQHEYVDWLLGFARIAKRKLRPDGSFVVDLGGAYQRGVPARSLYNFRVAIRMCDELGYTLAEDFYWFNPSKLPSPIEWVNKRKLRAKDSVNTVWWFGRSEWPKADVSNVLEEYSARMKKLLRNPAKYYRPKERPSGHDISAGFAKNNGGAIPSNLLQIPNSGANGRYEAACKLAGVKPHPARFPLRLPQFFIRFLTQPGDLVVDFFAGSNTTGEAAEREGRAWIAFEELAEYLAASAFRFTSSRSTAAELRALHAAILGGTTADLRGGGQQALLFREARAPKPRSPRAAR